MGIETIRADVATRVELAKTSFAGGYTLLVDYDNRELVDMATQVNPFLQVSVRPLDGEQAALGDSAEHRISGVIALTAAAPCGSGTSKVNKLLDHFVKELQGKSFGTVRTHFARPGGDKEHLQWYYVSFLVPFWSDQPAH